MMKTKPLFLCALLANAVESKGLQVGNFRMVQATSRSGWKENADIMKTDERLLKQQRIRDLDRLLYVEGSHDDDAFEFMDMSMSMPLPHHPHDDDSSDDTGPPSSVTPEFPTPAPVASNSTSLPPSTSAPTAAATTTAPAPTAPSGDVVWTCMEDGVHFVHEPPSVTTEIDITVGYVVESLAELEDYQADLDLEIYGAAVIGALQCAEGGPVFGPDGQQLSCECVTINTVPTGASCTPEIEGSVCTVLETEFTFLVDENLDPEGAALLSYVNIQEAMEGGAILEEIPLLDRIEYLSPLPLLPPLVEPDEEEDPIDGQLGESRDSVTVNAWTVGAVLAMCIGGAISLWVWIRNRKTRHRRHVALMEDMSLGSPPESSGAEA